MKKIVFVITFLNFVVSYTQEETILESTETDEEIIEVEIDDDGNESLNINSYDSSSNSVDIVTGEIKNILLIFKGKNTNLYGLKDKNGKVLVKPIFSSIDSYNSTKNRIIASLTYNKKGLIDNKGTIIIPFEYSYFYKNQNFYKCTKNGQATLFDYDGNSILKKFYEGIEFYNHQFKVKENGLYGVLNLKGNEIIPIEYDEITYHEQKKWYSVVKNGVSNIINNQGENVFGKKYTSLSKIDYNLNYLLAEKNGEFGIINTSGKEITPSIFKAIKFNYDDSRFIVKQKERWGVYDIYFKQFLIDPNYDNIKKISKGHYLLTNSDKKILHNLILNTKTDLSEYGNINDYISNGLIITVEKNKLYGAYNLEVDKLVIPQKYQSVYSSSYYIQCKISNSKFYDIYNLKGKILVKNVQIKSFNSNYNYKRITSEGKVGVLIKDKVIIDVKYNFIKDFKNAKYVLVKSDNKNGLVSLIDGEFIIPLNTNTITVIADKNTINWKNKNYTVTPNKLVEIK